MFINTTLFNQMAEKFESGEFQGDMSGWWLIPDNDDDIAEQIFSKIINRFGDTMWANAGQLAHAKGSKVCLFAAGFSIAKPDTPISSACSDGEYFGFGVNNPVKLAEDIFGVYWQQFDKVFIHAQWSDDWRERYYKNHTKTMAQICRLIAYTKSIDCLNWNDDEIDKTLVESNRQLIANIAK